MLRNVAFTFHLSLSLLRRVQHLDAGTFFPFARVLRWVLSSWGKSLHLLSLFFARSTILSSLLSSWMSCFGFSGGISNRLQQHYHYLERRRKRKEGKKNVARQSPRRERKNVKNFFVLVSRSRVKLTFYSTQSCRSCLCSDCVGGGWVGGNSHSFTVFKPFRCRNSRVIRVISPSASATIEWKQPKD